MNETRIGVAVSASDSNAALSVIEDLEKRGLRAAWMTSGSAGGADSLGLFAAAATRTQQITLGTAITQTFSRHPVAMAQQVLVLAQLAPERFRLGLGTSGRAGMEQTLGVDFRAPLSHLREYIRIEKSLLQQGSVDFSGRHYEAHTSIPSPVNVPVMGAALGVQAFQMCGAEADGAISWVCPGSYLHDVALPAMRTGADRAGRTVPPLVAHLPYASTTTLPKHVTRSGSSSPDLPALLSTRKCSSPPGSLRYLKVPGVTPWWIPLRLGATNLG